MKKIIYSLFLSLALFSCSFLQIDENKLVYSHEIREVLSRKVKSEIDLKVVRAESKISQVSFDTNTRRLNIVFELEVRHALNSLLGLSGEKLQVIANTDYLLRNNQIIAKDVRISNVIGVGDNSFIIAEITNFIANVMLEGTVIYDFNEVPRFKNRIITRIYPSFNSFYVDSY